MAVNATTKSKAPEATLRTLKNQHHRVVKEYSELKERVLEYSARRWITPGEQMEVQALQRAKLQKKDLLGALNRELNLLEDALEAATD